MTVFADDLFAPDLFIAGLFAGDVPAVTPNITTTILPDAVVSQAYSQQLAASGVDPKTWALLSGSLPLGLQFNVAGLISGTPRQVESATFTVGVVNSEGADTQDLTIDVGTDAALEIGDDYGLQPQNEGPVDYEKTPDEIINIPFEWASKLAGATISSTSFELPDGLASEAESTDGTQTEIRVSGGTGERTYRVIGKIATSDSQLFEQVKRVVVAEG